MSYGAYLGPLATVADAERKAVALGPGQETADMLYLLTDSQSAPLREPLRGALSSAS